MNKLKANILYNILLIVLGIALIVAGIVVKNEMCISMGTLMVLILIIKLVRLAMRGRNEESRKKYEAEVNDERINTIAGKSAIIAYIVLEFTLLGVLIFCMFMSYEALMSPLSLIMAAGILAYIISYFVLNKKM